MRILLADDSPHAQRMGERILREEGFDVVSVTDGETALLRMADVDPDLVIADIFLPKRSGYDLCRFVKTTPKHSHVRVVLTAGLLEPFDEEQARGVHFDAVLKKPFEATAMLDLVKPLLNAAGAQRQAAPAPEPLPAKVPAKPAAAVVEPASDPVPAAPASESRERKGLGLRGLFDRKPTVIRVVPDMTDEPAPPLPPPPKPQLVVKPAPPPPATSAPAPAPAAATPAPGTGPDSAIERYARQFLSKSGKPEAPPADPEAVRAAVTLALDAAMPALIDEITKRVLAALDASRTA